MIRVAIGRILLWFIKPAETEQFRTWQSTFEYYDRWFNPPEGLEAYRRWFTENVDSKISMSPKDG
jgi:hypothetical protein